MIGTSITESEVGNASLFSVQVAEWNLVQGIDYRNVRTTRNTKEKG